MALEEHLMEGERVLAQAGGFFASDRRLIRYQKQLWMEEMDELRYSQISLISLERRRRQGLFSTGLVFLALSILLFLIPVALSLFRELVEGIPSLNLGPLPALLLALGLLLIALCFLLPQVYFQIKAPGIDIRNEGRFRITGVRSAPVKGLLEAIRRQLYSGPEGRADG